jgi:uncharacterized OB-fold protein
MSSETYLPHNVDRGGIANPDTDDWDTRPWWEACARHEFVMQRCTACGTHRYPPKPVCYQCQSLDYDWPQIEGHGLIYSYEIVVHPVHPSLRDRVPYIAVVVELPQASGERIIGNLLDAQPEDVEIGLEVALIWEDVEDGLSLPQWRLSERRSHG